MSETFQRASAPKPSFFCPVGGVRPPAAQCAVGTEVSPTPMPATLPPLST